ncbi:MAG: hypothetical protein M5U26_15260 [Planctomycetota bacterium]|nr:hypothetical protein [Planctomycetota bacterium]
MSRSEETAHPILATVVGCGFMSIVPLLLLAGIGYAGWVLLNAEDDKVSDVPGREELERQRALEAERARQRNYDPSAREATKEERLNAILARMASPQAQDRRNAVVELNPWYEEDPEGLRRKLLDRLKGKPTPGFVEITSWLLCEYYGETGESDVLDQAIRYKADRERLEALARGIQMIRDNTKRNAMKQRLTAAMTGGKATADPKDEY